MGTRVVSCETGESGWGAAGSDDVLVRSTNATALFVTLTTLAQGRFSDNAFAVLPGSPKTVTFEPFGDAFNATLLESSLRVEHLAEGQGLF